MPSSCARSSVSARSNRSGGLVPVPSRRAPSRAALRYTQPRLIPSLRATSCTSTRPSVGGRSLSTTRLAIASMSSSSRITARHPNAGSGLTGRRTHWPVRHSPRRATRRNSRWPGLDADRDGADATSVLSRRKRMYTTLCAAIRPHPANRPRRGRAQASAAPLADPIAARSGYAGVLRDYAAESGSQRPPDCTASELTRRDSMVRSRSTRRIRHSLPIL